MKYNKIIILIACIIILSGCTKSKNDIGDPKQNTQSKSIPEPTNSSQEKDKTKEKNIKVLPIDLRTEKGILNYLVGEWTFDNDYKTQVACKMNIDKELNVDLSFYNAVTKESKGDYSGKISFDRIYSETEEAPDIISIDLMDEDNPGGDFFFLHRTIYDGKRVMSLFFAGNGNTVFDVLGPESYESTPVEIVFEKVTEEKPKMLPRKNDYFYAVFWGYGEKDNSIWIDDVLWDLPKEDDYGKVYPAEMINYENPVKDSILYEIAPGYDFDILGDDMFQGEVYFVEVDENGNIMDLVSAEYKKYIESGSQTTETKDIIFDILINDVDEISEYMDVGMKFLFDGETIMLNDEEFYCVDMGTDHEEHFVREVHYAVNAFTRQVYKLNVIDDVWELVTNN